MIYIAGPLFTRPEHDFNRKLADSIINKLKEEVFLPQAECSELDQDKIFERCRDGLNMSRLVVAILDGTDSDSGTCWECGYAYALGIPVIGVRTDFRDSNDDRGLNLMLSRSCSRILFLSSKEYDDPIPHIVKSIPKS